jgi:two-component system chemotaxis sensor kinase CheA
LALGKPAHGSLSLKAKVEGEALLFEITDDGRGIDWGAVAEKAAVLQLPHTSQADLLEALCTEGLTTCSSVSELSGRGVGMASFREQVRALSGRLEVRSAKGIGTSWLVRFDWPLRPVLHTAPRIAASR